MVFPTIIYNNIKIQLSISKLFIIILFYHFFIKIFFFFRLVRYLHPTDKELRQLLGLKKKDSKQSKRSLNGHNENVDLFQIPKNLNIEVSIYFYFI